MPSRFEDTLVDSLYEDADSDRGMCAGDMPNWLVRRHLEDLYGDLDRLFSVDLHRCSPRLDLDSPDSDH